MYLTNVKKFVRMGTNVIPTHEKCMKEMLGPALFAGMGVFFCCLLKGYYLLIALALVLIVALNMIITYKISSCTMTLRRCLMLKSVLYVTYIIVLSLFELIFFLMWKGLHPSVILLYIPIIIIPIWIMWQNYRIMKKETEYTPKSTVVSNIGKMGFTSGIIGANIARIFKNVEQSTAIIIILIGVTFVNSLMSVGLGFIQKVYWAEKYRITFEDDNKC